MLAAVPENENERLLALQRLELIDTAAEPEFDELVQTAAAICEVPISLLTLLDERRQWFKASVGLDAVETARKIAFCSHTILQTDLLVVEDAANDPRFSNNPMVTGDPHIRFYAGIPISSPEGLPVGTLCVIDRKPRTLTQLQRNMLGVLAHQINARMELRLQRRQLHDALKQAEKSRTELRASEERFRVFMDNSPFVSFMKDGDGKLVFYSQKLAERFGISSTAWIGKNDFEIWPEDQAQALRNTDIGVLLAGRLHVVYEQVPDKTGNMTHWRSYKFPCISSRGTTLLGGIAVDVTEETAKEAALHRTQAELQSANALLKELVVTDPLTGLGNRRVLDERLAAELTATRRGRTLALLMLDIDSFKHRNDTFGHQDGDQILMQMGNLLRREVRGNEIAARYGGEELAVLMPNTSEEEAAGLAARLLTAVRRTDWPHQPITISIGVAQSSRDITSSQLVANADAALYGAKTNGRDRFVRWSQLQK